MPQRRPAFQRMTLANARARCQCQKQRHAEVARLFLAPFARSYVGSTRAGGDGSRAGSCRRACLRCPNCRDRQKAKDKTALVIWFGERPACCTACVSAWRLVAFGHEDNVSASIATAPGEEDKRDKPRGIGLERSGRMAT